MVELTHHVQDSFQFLFRDIANAYTLANLGDEGYALLAMTMFDRVLAALPGQFKIKVVGVCRQIEHFHAVEDPSNVVHIDVTTEVAENDAEEAINVNGLAVHNVRTGDHLQQFRECVACQSGQTRRRDRKIPT